MPHGIAMRGPAPSAKIFFSRQRVVRRAPQREVRRFMPATLRERLDVMNLDKPRFGATLASRASVRAAPVIA
jgi:hypothetical protein